MNLKILKKKMKNNKKIDICHLSTVHNSDDIRIFQKEAQTLVNAGFKVVIVALKPKTRVQKTKIPKILIQDRKSSRLGRMLNHCSQGIGIVQKMNPHVCHFHDPELIPWVILFLKPLGIRLVYDVHEDYEKQFLSKKYLPFGLRTIFGKMVFLMEYVGSLFFEKIIAATPQIAKKFPKEKTFLVQNFP